MNMNIGDVRFCCTADAAAVPLLFLTGTFESQRNV